MLRQVPPRTSANQACEHALRRALLRGELAPGQRLPPERTLATTLGVSRLTLRAALAALTTQGLLVVRQGSGYIVQDVARAGGSDLLGEVAELAHEYGDLEPVATDLLRVRRHLAQAVLEHLVDHPPKQAAIRAFDAAVDAMAAAVETGDSETIAGADLDVVAALLDATDSSVFRLTMNPVTAVMTNSPRLRDAMYADPASNVAGWRAVAIWLRKPVRASAFAELLASRDAATLARLSKRKGRR